MTQDRPALMFSDWLPIRVRMLIIGLAVIGTMAIAGWFNYAAQQRVAERGFYLYDTIFQSVSYARAAQTDLVRLRALLHLDAVEPDKDRIAAFTVDAYGRAPAETALFYIGEAQANLEVASDSALPAALAERCQDLITRLEAVGPPLQNRLTTASIGASARDLMADLDTLASDVELFVQDLAAEGFRVRLALGDAVSRSVLSSLVAIGAATVIVFTLSILFGAHILARIRTVTDFSARVAEGDLDGTVEIKGRTELTMLMRALVGMRGAIRHQIEEIDRLIGSILPRPVARRLRAGEERIADARAEATIVFVDLAGFTELSRRMGARHLIETIDTIFSDLDEAAERHGIEKIKTIGDGYMAAAGVTGETGSDDAARCAAFALDARTIVRALAERLGYPLDVRIGIHNGPVVAGVLGKSRLAFDVWGETVNLAARLEGSAERGEIRVSEAAYWRLHKRFALTSLGETPLKGIGAVTTYRLEDKST